MKLKSQYKKLDVEEEKNYKKQHQRPNFVSNDKSKSFYSSDVENNTLFDQNHIVMEDQSNSSNFFSNVNNSNSHLFLDDSVITKALDIS